LVKRGEGRFSDKKLSATPFDDLKRELLSRKYSYKTVKGYLYYNRDFLNFIKKSPHEVITLPQRWRLDGYEPSQRRPMRTKLFTH
jgi:hypothetical protein